MRLNALPKEKPFFGLVFLDVLFPYSSGSVSSFSEGGEEIWIGFWSGTASAGSASTSKESKM